ncbi:MAG TPA: adenylate/guanylate cyclase domain-containing protein [Acidimicrobiia bacterium]|nr:adenylate/guanylate cyclase domain-containing protein [Acidimicrobiia bacterium]
MSEPAPAVIVVEPGTVRERTVPVIDRLVVGRECAGIDDGHRLVLDDDTVSRQHLEIRLDEAEDRAVVLDMSTNGTRVNGVRIERAVPIPIRPGDGLQVGETHLEFQSDRFLTGGQTDRRRTTRYVSQTSMVLVVGDVVGYSTISEVTDSSVVLDSLDVLWDGLRRLLMDHGGTLNSYAGDALFAVFESDPVEHAAARAVDFVRAAHRHVQETAPTLPLRSPDGTPVQMGWAVVLGPVAVSTLTRAQPAVIGDTTNLAFRLSGRAAREGLPEILVNASARDVLGDAYDWGEPHTVTVKGRSGEVVVFGVSA